MNVKLFIVFSSIVLLQVGCGMQNESELPNTVAFQDEFTKSFLESSEEVEKGHYLFKSDTGGYTVHFPINASMDKAVYETAGDEFEAVGFVENDKAQNLSYYYNINYDDQPRANDIQFKLGLFDSYINYTGDFLEYTENNTTYFYAENVFAYEGKKSYRYFAYIKPEVRDKGINFLGRITCIDYELPCKQDSREAKEKVLNIMHSINFTSR